MRNDPNDDHFVWGMLDGGPVTSQLETILDISITAHAEHHPRRCTIIR